MILYFQIILYELAFTISYGSVLDDGDMCLADYGLQLPSPNYDRQTAWPNYVSPGSYLPPRGPGASGGSGGPAPAPLA